LIYLKFSKTMFYLIFFVGVFSLIAIFNFLFDPFVSNLFLAPPGQVCVFLVFKSYASPRQFDLIEVFYKPCFI
jgi:hypothetical protein